MDKQLTYHASKIFYRDEGPGSIAPPQPGSPPPPPVVLIHGLAEDGDSWSNQINYLKNQTRLLIPDVPGSGRSITGNTATSIEELAESIKAILDEESIDKAILIGHSMGGYVALAFAEKYPERLGAFGLFHSTAYKDSEEKIATRRKSIEFIRKHGAAAWIRQSTPNLFGPTTKTQAPGMISGLIEKYEQFAPETLIAYQEAMIRRPDRTAILRNFEKPILLIAGEYDNAVPLQQSLEQFHLPQQAWVYILENSGHEGMLEEAGRSNQILESFIQSHHSLYK